MLLLKKRRATSLTGRCPLGIRTLTIALATEQRSEIYHCEAETLFIDRQFIYILAVGIK